MSRAALLQYGRRLGWAGALFFLVKGLAWLLLPAAIAYLGAEP